MAAAALEVDVVGGNFGGTWLSDYVPNRLGGFEGEIPDEDFDEDCDEGMGMRQ